MTFSRSVSEIGGDGRLVHHPAAVPDPPDVPGHAREHVRALLQVAARLHRPVVVREPLDAQVDELGLALEALLAVGQVGRVLLAGRGDDLRVGLELVQLGLGPLDPEVVVLLLRGVVRRSVRLLHHLEVHVGQRPREPRAGLLGRVEELDLIGAEDAAQRRKVGAADLVDLGDVADAVLLVDRLAREALDHRSELHEDVLGAVDDLRAGVDAPGRRHGGGRTQAGPDRRDGGAGLGHRGQDRLVLGVAHLHPAEDLLRQAEPIPDLGDRERRRRRGRGGGRLGDRLQRRLVEAGGRGRIEVACIGIREAAPLQREARPHRGPDLGPPGAADAVELEDRLGGRGVGVPLQRHAGAGRAPGDRAGAALLDDMGELVGDQRVPDRGPGHELVRAEGDVAADRDRPRLQRAGQVGGGRVVVDAHAGEVGAERPPHPIADRPLQRPPATEPPLQVLGPDLLRGRALAELEGDGGRLRIRLPRRSSRPAAGEGGQRSGRLPGEHARADAVAHRVDELLRRRRLAGRRRVPRDRLLDLGRRAAAVMLDPVLDPRAAGDLEDRRIEGVLRGGDQGRLEGVEELPAAHLPGLWLGPLVVHEPHRRLGRRGGRFGRAGRGCAGKRRGRRREAPQEPVHGGVARAALELAQELGLAVGAGGAGQRAVGRASDQSGETVALALSCR